MEKSKCEHKKTRIDIYRRGDGVVEDCKELCLDCGQYIYDSKGLTTQHNPENSNTRDVIKIHEILDHAYVLSINDGPEFYEYNNNQSIHFMGTPPSRIICHDAEFIPLHAAEVLAKRTYELRNRKSCIEQMRQA